MGTKIRFICDVVHPCGCKHGEASGVDRFHPARIWWQVKETCELHGEAHRLAGVFRRALAAERMFGVPVYVLPDRRWAIVPQVIMNHWGVPC